MWRVPDHKGGFRSQLGSSMLGGDLQSAPRDRGAVVAVHAERPAGEVLREAIVLQFRLCSRGRVPGQQQRDDTVALPQSLEDLDNAWERPSLPPAETLGQVALVGAQQPRRVLGRLL